MRVRHLIVLLVAMVVATLGAWAPAGAVARTGSEAASDAAATHKARYVAGDLLVEFRAGVSVGQRALAVDRAGGKVVERLRGATASGDRVLVLVHSSSLSTTALARRYKADARVTRVSPNYVRSVDSTLLNDPELAGQWGVFDADVPAAWEVTTGSSDVVVASIDTGVEIQHPDLAANMWQNPDEVAGNGVDDDGNGYVDDVYGIDTVNDDSYPCDDYGHGTHTSGIMAAVSDNGVGVAGVCPQAQVMALKFIDEEGMGTDADAIDCIDYVTSEKVDHGVNVVAINASWGGDGSDIFLHDAIERAGDAGIVFCASAGNDDWDNDEWSTYPACYDCDTILSVAATTSSGSLADFSNWGECTVDLAAPGDGILSSLTDGLYASWSGTSMAAPFVTGAVALCAAAYPDETAEERVERIMESVRQEDWLDGKCVSGGRLDVGAAVKDTSTDGDTTAPTTTVLGGDALTHDVPVKLCLCATDGATGSGVATTEWRIDGGEWQSGTTIRVPARLRAALTRTVEYRSTDRAGNVEDIQSCQVSTDTRYIRRDDALPGALLPASPVRGGVCSSTDARDVYRVRLRAGQTLRATLAEGLGTDVIVRLLPAGAGSLRAKPVARWRTSTSAALVYRASRSGTYHLVVQAPRGWYDEKVQPYSIAWKIHEADDDVTPPQVTIGGHSSTWTAWPVTVTAWSASPVTLTAVADDHRWGSGVAVVETSVDDGLTWTATSTVVVDASADHGNDGSHWVLARARDVAGNVSKVVRSKVRIDTEGPTTQAWGPVKAVRRGRVAVIRYTITDREDSVLCTLVVRSQATGRIVLKKNLGRQWTGTLVSWWGYEVRNRCRIHADLPRGTYTVQIAGATRDGAGNRWVTATCERELTVK